jgi:hypothetical protein
MQPRLRHTLVAVPAFLALAARGAAAQDAPLASPAPLAVSRDGSSPGRALGGSLLGGAAGALVGGVAGAYIGGNRCGDAGNPDSCYGLEGVVLGTAAGFTLGAPVGAHLANRRAGSLGWSLLASATAAAAGVVALRIIDERPPGTARGVLVGTVAISVPLLQVVSATLIETRTGRR